MIDLLVGNESFIVMKTFLLKENITIMNMEKDNRVAVLALLSLKVTMGNMKVHMTGVEASQIVVLENSNMTTGGAMMIGPHVSLFLQKKFPLTCGCDVFFLANTTCLFISSCWPSHWIVCGKKTT